MQWLILAQEVKTGMTAWDFLHANWGWFAAALLAMGTFVTGGFAALGRALWSVYSDWVKKHNEREDEKAKKEGKALETLTETLPVLAENGNKLTVLITESRKIDSDIIKEVSEIKTGIDDLASAIVDHACPETQKIMEARLAANLERVKRRKQNNG